MADDTTKALVEALRKIAASSQRSGPPDFKYWWDVANDRREIARAALATHDASAGEKRADAPWPIGTRVEKIKGSSWRGRVVGYYRTALTTDGMCVESEREPGSVQIYPRTALRRVEEAQPAPAPAPASKSDEDSPLNFAQEAQIIIESCDWETPEDTHNLVKCGLERVAEAARADERRKIEGQRAKASESDEATALAKKIWPTSYDKGGDFIAAAIADFDAALTAARADFRRRTGWGMPL